MDEKQKIIEKLFNNRQINQLTGCWIWLGNIGTHGYGRIWLGSRTSGTRYVVHRLSAELFREDFKSWLQVNHHCDNKICFNPEHLYSGMQQENVRDKYKRGRANHAKGEENGRSKLTIEQVKKIRHDYVSKSLMQLAEEHNVSHATIAAIVNRETWKLEG